MPESFAFSKLTDKEIEKILKENKIGLTVSEAREIERILGRPPTLTEAVIFGIQGSEHCSYRSTKKYLKTLPTKAPNVILGVGEDAGVVEIINVDGERYGLVMGHESHNHPSQIVPFEGASTGVGGIVRDIACMGAKVIGTMDPLRFGDIKKNPSRRIANGVIAGIAGYGNPLGIPNLGGDVYFDESYDDNCLVNVVALGLVKESELIHSFVPEEAAEVGYDIIIVGKPTDCSGMGGAAFASIELDEKNKEANKGAVQEPNPFLKRHILVSSYELFKIIKEKGYINKVSFKDMGAGGNVCSTVEQVAKAGYGADVYLDKIHVSMQNLHPSVIACSETQERFAWVCHPDLTQMILDHYNVKWDLPSVAENARASLVGRVRKGNYTTWFNGEKECDAPAKVLTEGLQYDRAVEERKYDLKEPELEEKSSYNDDLLKLLASENIASRRPVFEKYDKQVRGDTVIESGEADATILAPLLGEEVSEKYKKVGIALSCDGNPRYGKISPYYQGVNAVVESMRNVAAVGAEPIALTDCLNYGNPEKPNQMWEFAEGVRGIKDACEAIRLKQNRDYPTPIISGNVSLYNESKGKPIAPTAVIACAGRIMDYEKAVKMQLKGAGNLIYLLGARKNELGGSEYYRLLGELGANDKAGEMGEKNEAVVVGGENGGELGANVPKPDFKEVESQIYAMSDAVPEGFVESAHDISDGGIAVALAEMCFGGRGEGELGCDVDLAGTGKGAQARDGADKKTENGVSDLKVFQILFSETGGFIVEVTPENCAKFEEICSKNSVKELYKIGKVENSGKISITVGEKKIVDLDLEKAKSAWWNGLREKM